MPGAPLGVDHRICNVHVDIVGVLVNPAMALMLGKTQRDGEAFLNGLEVFRREPGLVFRPERNEQVIGLFLAAAGVHGLCGLDFHNGKIVIVVSGTTGAPVRKTFFAVMPGVGDVAGQCAVVVVRGFAGNMSADHRILMAADFSSRIPASISRNRRCRVILSPFAAMACFSKPPSLPRSARALMIS